MAERIAALSPSRLPGPCSVYVFSDADGAPLYVGITRKSALRVAQHARKSWWADVATATFEHYPNGSAAAAREMELIRELRPVHNITFNESQEKAA